MRLWAAERVDTAADAFYPKEPQTAMEVQVADWNARHYRGMAGWLRAEAARVREEPVP